MFCFSLSSKSLW